MKYFWVQQVELNGKRQTLDSFDSLRAAKVEAQIVSKRNDSGAILAVQDDRGECVCAYQHGQLLTNSNEFAASAYKQKPREKEFVRVTDWLAQEVDVTDLSLLRDDGTIFTHVAPTLKMTVGELCQMLEHVSDTKARLDEVQDGIEKLLSGEL